MEGVTRLFTIGGVVWAALVLAGAGPARAGTWIQVSCVNPDGSAAPSDGWTSFITGTPGYASNNDTACFPGSPMSASLSTAAPAPVGSSEDLEYQPPSGSKLIGGSVNVTLSADGTHTGGNASGTAVLYEPAFQYDGSDVFFQCASGLAPCANGTNDYSGELALPSNRGGNFYIGAGCGGAPGYSCDSGGRNGAWASVQLSSARFLLSSSASPEGANFGGSALQRGAHGTAHLVFTATDPGGPGVYAAQAALDGRPVWQGAPSTNAGACVAVGTDPSSGAQMFDSQQPCLVTETVDVPVSTDGLSDGAHELTVVVQDAAGNSATVLDQQITTSNPLTTPAPHGRLVHARFVISWSWLGRRTVLRSIRAERLPHNAHVRVECAGRGCPRLRVRSATARRVGRLERALGGRRFQAGDRLRLTVTAPRHTAERIQLLIRDNRLPRARLLERR